MKPVDEATLSAESSPAKSEIEPDLSRIALWPGIEGNRWRRMAEVLRGDYGSAFSVVCSMPEDIALTKRYWQGLTEDVVPVTDLYRSLKDPVDSEASILSRARDYERRYNVLMVDLLQSDRHLGLAYSSAGTLYPRSRLGQSADYIRSVRLAMRFLDFFEEYFDQRGTTLLLMEAAACLHTKCIAEVARRRGIPIRCPSPSRFQNWAHWAEGEFFLLPKIERVYRQTPATVTAEFSFGGSYKASADEKARQTKRMGLGQTFKYCAKDVLRFFYQRLIGYRSYAGNYLRDIMAYRLRAYSRHRMLERHSISDLDQIKRFKYVFYPLNHEPEGSLSVMSPEFNHQGAVIDLIAKALPADVRLVVKEHETTGIAARPKGFYEWLIKLPNVVLASMHFKSEPLIQSAQAVAVLNGTAGMEAAVLGIPVVTFSRHNIYNCIPHVHVVDRISELRPLMQQLCELENKDREQRLVDGKRFIDALKSCSIDLGDEPFFSGRPTVSESTARRYTELLVESLKGVTAA